MKKKVKLVTAKQHKKYDASMFVLFARPSPGYKTGFILSRKTGSAAKRSRAKRIIREFWRKKHSKGDFVFILRPPSTSSSCKLSIFKALENASEKIPW